MPADERSHAPATARNRAPIAQVLRSVLPSTGTVLEVASGTGEHAVAFARLFPHLTWQPSDLSAAALRSIAAWAAVADLSNVRAPLILDAAGQAWPIERADAVLCVNLLHISPWTATVGLMRGAGRVLGSGAPLVIYGPFVRSDAPIAPSNRAFDAELRRTDPSWGLRDLDEVCSCAADHGLLRQAVFAMPANNLAVVFRRG